MNQDVGGDGAPQAVCDEMGNAATEWERAFMHPDGEQLRQITALVEAGIIQPVIDKVFPFAQTAEALAYVETGRAKGKVVISVLDEAG